ncbi:DNA mismatch repair endonuclease MutL [Thermodesulfovibrio sp. 3907-1M]|uniref:DNA mismatch repair protein MutL n=1 Tax=Thermodesulfovibrio autotrophicus TaxID=3118333 RepID=A0AAU8GWD8_9BACT
MGKIQILPESIVGKIAAGEVVERPASVVKELIENSIDAGANSISVYIKKSGIAEIKVIDDGEGIASEDVLTAFQRHATSKIKDDRDLIRISSLGFRGEALYSIAQVSKIKIITQHITENTGTETYFVAGSLKWQKPAVTRGTTIEVSELFFNTPVRRKFLKSPYTEKAHIIETFQNYCLAYPEISFSLFIDDEEILNIPETDSIYKRIWQVFGVELAENLKIKTISKDDYRVELFLGDGLKGKSKVFLNRRPVKEQSIVGNICKAFQLMQPQFIVFITVPPEEADFNVHPAKTQVRFCNPQKIHQLIFRMAEAEPSSLSSAARENMVAEKPSQWEFNSVSAEQIAIFHAEPVFSREFFVLGDSIVVVKEPHGVVFLDYHAAHERVNFEKILNKNPVVVKLVFPVIVNLSSDNYIVIKENLPILHELGIEAEDFGKNSIIIRALPEFIQNGDVAGIVESIAQTLKEEISKPDLIEIKRKIAAQVACHTSLRANDKINYVEIKILLQELEKTTDPEHCPHGRPVKKYFSIDEIKKWFLR